MTNAEARAILNQIRTMLAVDDDGPEGAMGPRWVLGQVRELVSQPDTLDAQLHADRLGSRDWRG